MRRVSGIFSYIMQLWSPRQVNSDYCSRCHAWARLYPNKLPVTAVQLLNNDVLSSFEQHNATVEAVLSDNGRKFCGRDGPKSL